MMFEQYQGFIVISVLLFFLGGTIWCFDSGSKWRWFFLAGLALYVIIPVIVLILAIYHWLVDMYLKQNTFY